jgi:hypothetical protein
VFSAIKGFGEDVFGGLQDAFGGFLKDVIKGTKSVGDAMEAALTKIGDAIIDALVDKLIVSGVVGLFSTLLGGFFDGVIGSILGDFGLGGFKNGGMVGSVAMAGGGFVPMAEGSLVSGSGYSDSVRALLMPGELVTPYRDVQRNVAAGRAPGDSGLPRRGESGSTNVTLVVQSIVPVSRAEIDRVASPMLARSIADTTRRSRRG